MTVSIKHMEMLSMMENSPRYAVQLVRQKPALFAQQTAGTITMNASVYKMLKYLAKLDLVKQDTAYKPPTVLRELIGAGRARRVIWWTLTDKGRALLNDWRERLKPVPYPTPTITELTGKRAGARRKRHVSK